MIPNVKNTMTHASLFSGIGGAELAARWVGWKNVFHCEINPFGRRVIEYHFPESKSYEDVTTTDFSEYRGRIDVLTAGFPCQPFSVAGQRKGADDNRYLWPQVVRVIREVQPDWVVGENVAGILTMVQPGEEVEVGSDYTLFGENDRKRVLLRQEYVIETICRDLEREGYEVQPFVIPACAVGALHRRDRVWIIAHRSDAGVETVQCGREDGVYATGLAADTDINRQRERTHQQVTVSGCQGTSYDCACGEDGVIANTKCFGGREIYDEIQSQQSDGQVTHSNGDERHVTYTDNKLLPCRNHKGHEEWKDKRFILEPCGCQTMWRNFPTQPPVCSRDDGLSARLDGITFSKWRRESIKAYGNAWVPAVAYEIFKAIEETK